MQELLNGAGIGGVLALGVAAIAAVRSWFHSAKARELLEELVVDITEDLRDEIAQAIAEGANQVIDQLKIELENHKRGGTLQ